MFRFIQNSDKLQVITWRYVPVAEKVKDGSRSVKAIGSIPGECIN